MILKASMIFFGWIDSYSRRFTNHHCHIDYHVFINWKLTLICLVPFPIMLIATYFFKESVNKSFIQVRNAVAALNAFVQEHISGMQVVQAFAAEEREMRKFEKLINNIKWLISKLFLLTRYFSQL